MGIFTPEELEELRRFDAEVDREFNLRCSKSETADEARERQRKRCAAYYQANKQKILEKRKKYAQDNPEKVRAYKKTSACEAQDEGGRK